MNENVSLKPDESWRPTLLDTNMLQLFFNVCCSTDSTVRWCDGDVNCKY